MVLYRIMQYILICLLLTLVNVGLQIIFRKRLMAHWCYITECSTRETLEKMEEYPPIDGWWLTIWCDMIPVLNVGYLLFIISIIFGKEDGILGKYLEAVRLLKMEGKWKG